MDGLLPGEIIRRERKRRGYTLKQLAKLACISFVYLSDIERGNRIPPPLTVKRICDSLGQNGLLPVLLKLYNKQRGVVEIYTKNLNDDALMAITAIQIQVVST